MALRLDESEGRPSGQPSVVILRHGPTDWNEQRRWQGGEVDFPLSLNGRDYVGRMAEELHSRGIGQEFFLAASPMLRATETAEILRSCGVGAGPIFTVDQLREARLGGVSGLTEDEVERDFPELFGEWQSGYVPSYPEGESREQIAQRVGGALAILMQLRRPVLAVAHKTILRAARLVVGLPSPEHEGHLSGVECWITGEQPGGVTWMNITRTSDYPIRTPSRMS